MSLPDHVPPAAEEQPEKPGQESGEKLKRDNQNFVDDEQLHLAAAYVSDAQYNRNIQFETSPKAIRFYKLYNHWSTQGVTYFFILVDLFLGLFEDPAVYLLPLWVTSTVEFICLLMFTVRLLHFSKVTPTKVFWKDAKNICVIVSILLTLVDMIVYLVLIENGYPAVRWSRVLRPLFCVNFTESRQLRRAFRNIRNTLPEITYVFVLFLFSVAVFSLMALKLFAKRKLTTGEGAPYFSNYLDVLFNLYVLVTTANSPDVMMPAYEVSWAYSIFFIVFIIVNTYVFMSLFLAVVYNDYKKHLKNEVRKLVYMKHRKMIEAFNILKTKNGTEFAVLDSHWRQLVKLVAPEIPSSHRELLWRVLDDEQKGFIGKESFIRLADLLNIQIVQMKERVHPLEKCMPNMYNSAVSQFICRTVKHQGFRYTYDVIIVINAIFIGGDETNPLISKAEWVFLSLYLIEILLKLYAHEPRAFFARFQFWNWFDTIIIVAALLGTIVNTALKSSGGYSSQQILDIVFILRVLRLIRIIDSFQRFRILLNTLVNLIPTMLTYAGLLVVVYYIFAIVGMEAFKGRIHFYGANSSDPAAKYCGNPALKGSQFAALRYCKNNFNNLLSSFILLIELTVVNQWHALATGFVKVTHLTARIFFVIFHIVVVIILINIFIAFVLEAFFVEYSLSRSAVETAVEKKIQELGMGDCADRPAGNLVEVMETNENDLGNIDDTDLKSRLRFRIASIRYKTVDALLQHMFEGELKPEDEIPTLEEIDNLSPDDFPPKPHTFDNVI
ncbi:two pore segment channel 3 isoform X1 [Pristis pectinata]|uniref:two pore segment channel 3 isoform X1 n=1 Tax=Pristis pectinata TaxID=685728 RepID=UPI00223E65D1|nr:two pore segment channel 3 isoform X1 [Pristis pectinata]